MNITAQKGWVLILMLIYLFFADHVHFSAAFLQLFSMFLLQLQQKHTILLKVYFHYLGHHFFTELLHWSGKIEWNHCNIKKICMKYVLFFRFIVLFFIMPETEQRSLEDIEIHYSDNSKGLTDIHIRKQSCGEWRFKYILKIKGHIVLFLQL